MTSPSSYQLLDAGHFRKLEQVGPYRLIRPAAQALWQPQLAPKAWQDCDAEFIRSKNGEGKWRLYRKNLPAEWQISLAGDLKMLIRLTDFGHIGIFPEHHQGERLRAAISKLRQEEKPFRLLNLFAYTGALSLLAAQAGAEVVHVDASRTSVAWAKDNAQASGLESAKIRWMVDDVKKFIKREIRRKANYQGIILDPPSFGRGNKGEVWKIEEDLLPLLADLKELQASDFSFMQLSSHSQGMTPLALHHVLSGYCPKDQGELFEEEMAVPMASTQWLMPSGAACVFIRS